MGLALMGMGLALMGMGLALMGMALALMGVGLALMGMGLACPYGNGLVGLGLVDDVMHLLAFCACRCMRVAAAHAVPSAVIHQMH